MEVYRHLSLAEVEPGYEQAVRDLSLAEADRQHRDSPKIGIEHTRLQDASGSSRANSPKPAL